MKFAFPSLTIVIGFVGPPIFTTTGDTTPFLRIWQSFLSVIVKVYVPEGRFER